MNTTDSNACAVHPSSSKQPGTSTSKLVVAFAMLSTLASAGADQAAPELSLVDSSYERIGTLDADGPPETSFASVAGAVLLPSGEVVVADDGNLEVRWFDASGGHLRSVGREGEGPGEFRYIHWIGLCPGGRLLVLDPMVGRATFLSAADGRVEHSVAVAATLRWNLPLSCQKDDRLLVLMDQLDGRIKPEMLGRVTRVPAEVVRFDLSGGARDTIQELPGSDFYWPEDIPGYSYLPLGGRALAAVGGGRLYAAQSDEDIVRMMDLRSGTWTTFAHRLPRTSVSREAWDRAVSRLIWRQPLERVRRLLTRVLEEAPVPNRQPAFLAMRVDPSGRLWLRLPGHGEATRWRVLDAEGGPVATIALPSNVELMDVGEQKLVALERGPLDVPMIRVYALPPSLRSNEGR